MFRVHVSHAASHTSRFKRAISLGLSWASMLVGGVASIFRTLSSVDHTATSRPHGLEFRRRVQSIILRLTYCKTVCGTTALLLHAVKDVRRWDCLIHQCMYLTCVTPDIYSRFSNHTNKIHKTQAIFTVGFLGHCGPPKSDTTLCTLQ